jgi:hypothetical protein
MHDRRNERMNGADDGRDALPIDFSSFGPPLTVERFDAAVAQAAARGARELERRRSGAGVVRIVVAWRRPLLAISALAAAASVMLLVRPARQATLAGAASSAATESSTIAEALGIPASYAESVEGRWTVAPAQSKEKP